VVGHCQITLANFVKDPMSKDLYCKTHFLMRFRTEGKYLGSEEYARN